MKMTDTARRNLALYAEYRAGKEDGLTQQGLGETYGLSQSNISRILRQGEGWLAFLRDIREADAPGAHGVPERLNDRGKDKGR